MVFVFSLLVSVAGAPVAPGSAAAASPPDRPLEAAEETGTGFTVMRFTGIGLHHRQFLQNGWGWGANGITIYTGTAWYTNVGGQVYYSLDRSEYQRLYLVGGVSYIQGAPAPYGLGAGLGWTLGRREGVALSLELPLVFEFNPAQDLVDYTSGQPRIIATTWTYDLVPLPAISLVFNY